MAFTDYGLSGFAKSFFQKAREETYEQNASLARTFDEALLKSHKTKELAKQLPWNDPNNVSREELSIERVGPSKSTKSHVGAEGSLTESQTAVGGEGSAEPLKPKKNTLPPMKTRKGIIEYLGEPLHVIRQRAMIEALKRQPVFVHHKAVHADEPDKKKKNRPARVPNSVIDEMDKMHPERMMNDTADTRASWNFDNAHGSMNTAIDDEIHKKPTSYGIHLGVLPVPNLWTQTVQMNGGSIPWVARNIDSRAAKDILIEKGLRPPTSYGQLIKISTVDETLTAEEQEQLEAKQEKKRRKREAKEQKKLEMKKKKVEDEKRNEYNTPSNYEKWVIKRRSPTHFFSKVDRLKTLHPPATVSPGAGHYYPFQHDIGYIMASDKAAFHRERNAGRVKAEKSGADVNRIF